MRVPTQENNNLAVRTVSFAAIAMQPPYLPAQATRWPPDEHHRHPIGSDKKFGTRFGGGVVLRPTVPKQQNSLRFLGLVSVHLLVCLGLKILVSFLEDRYTLGKHAVVAKFAALG